VQQDNDARNFKLLELFEGTNLARKLSKANKKKIKQKPFFFFKNTFAPLSV